MGNAELEQLDALLRKLLADQRIMEGLSLLERREIAGASQTIRSLIRQKIES